MDRGLGLTRNTKRPVISSLLITTKDCIPLGKAKRMGSGERFSPSERLYKKTTLRKSFFFFHTFPELSIEKAGKSDTK